MGFFEWLVKIKILLREEGPGLKSQSKKVGEEVQVFTQEINSISQTKGVVSPLFSFTQKSY